MAIEHASGADDLAMSDAMLAALPTPMLESMREQITAALRSRYEGSLKSRSDLYDDPVEQVAFSLAYELEHAEFEAGDTVTVNREKLRGIALRAIALVRESSAGDRTNG